ncbi:MAG: hypothetical protein KTR31_19095 [Myxococcales bacterium]|nr:hypothetical protein [Myxococcales bacterium]
MPARLFALLIGLLWTATPTALASELSWKEIYTSDGVTVSKASVPNSKFVAFKGDTVMDAPAGKVLHVLLDNTHRLEWVGRLYESTTLSRTSDFDYVVYQAFALPAIFSDRDYVYRGVATREAGTGAVILSLASTEHPEAPETVGVRAELVNSRYRLTPQGEKTRVEVEIVTDPKGAMPIWLVNLIQRSWPLDTLTGIRGMLDQPWVQEHPLP